MAMQAPPKKRAEPKSQRERFLEAARQAEADESGKAFERAIKKIIRRSKPACRSGS